MNKKAIFVGTDFDQDHSGLLQALQAMWELHIFEHTPGVYGQLWPRSAAEFESVRSHNARVLEEMIDRIGGVEVVIGQMWGLSMHWRTLDRLRERGITVVNIAMDDRHAWKGRSFADGTHAGTLGIARHISFALTAAPECVAWYEAEGTRAMFFPEASDPRIFRPGLVSKDVDVSFVGAAYGVRAKLVRAMERSGLRVQAYGNGWPLGRLATRDVPSLFARSRIVLGCGTIGHCDDFVALKLRDFDAPMSGSLYLTSSNPDFAALLNPGREIVTFDDVDDAVEKALHYVRHADEREEIAAAGRRRCEADHSWQVRWSSMMTLVEEPFNETSPS